MASGPPRGWPPTLARRVASVRAALNPPVRHVSRFPHGSRNLGVSSGVEGEELRKPDKRRLIPSAKDPIHTAKDIMVSVDKHFRITRCMEKEENRAAIYEFIARYGDVHTANVKEDGSKIVDAIYGDEDARRTVQDVIALCSDNSPRDSEKEGARNARGQSAIDVSDSEERQAEIANFYKYGYPCDGVPRKIVLAESRHQDCSIYRDNYHWKQEYRIADRNETRLEAMMLSGPSKDCIVKSGKCISHEPCNMFQILSLKLAKLPVDSGSVELYGYIAARDLVDPLLNYVVNISRDDPIIVEQGSLIETSGPKRGIELSRTVLLEYDMQIKTGDQEKDDLPLIDGVSFINEVTTLPEPFTNRIHGNYGAVDMTQMCVEGGVEATVEVVISEVQSSFNLCLSCFTSGLHEEIRLFDGVIGESRDLRRRHVLAVVMDTCMDLKVKVDSGSDCSAEHCRSFKATNHGCVSEQIKIKFASISVKVTWSTLDLKMLKLL